ncbi:UNVERIFIED_CONTAM: DNA-binding transcriptional regulator YhcF (GntR family) [Brevibacillus sp. OAP136]
MVKAVMERMDWKPTQQKGTPFYKQIAEHLERRISYGEFPAGSFLPSERTLARELNVNRSTIVAAYEELRAEGLVESIQGSGTRVSHDIWGLTKNRVPNWRPPRGKRLVFAQSPANPAHPQRDAGKRLDRFGER